MTVMSQVVGTPASWLPTTLPRAPTASATRIEAIPTSTVSSSLASTTRLRLGTMVNVVRPVRWLHSLVIERAAMIGSTIVIGMPMAPAKLS